MGKVEITDDCLAPRNRVKMFYTGKDPLNVAMAISGEFKMYFRVSSSKWNEDEFKWDVAGSNQEFTILYWVEKGFSAFTKMKIYFRFQGYQDKETKKGHCRIEIRPKLTTNFPENWIAKSMFSIYNYLFYNNIRRQYIEKCRSMTEGFSELIKRNYGMVESASGIPDRYA